MIDRRPGMLAAIAVASAAVAVALVLLLTRPSRVSEHGSAPVSTDSISGFAGAALPAAAPARDFALTDQSGRRVSLEAFRGQATVLAFLSTTCGAPCTLIAQQVRGALDELARPVP